MVLVLCTSIILVSYLNQVVISIVFLSQNTDISYSLAKHRVIDPIYNNYCFRNAFCFLFFFFRCWFNCLRL